MPTVTFVRDEKVLDHNGQVVEDWKAGQVAELSKASAVRWIRRGAAVSGVLEAQGSEYAGGPLADGASPDDGKDAPSSASPPAPASTTDNSTSSGEPETPTDAASSSSTAPSSAPDGPTSATAPTPRGGARPRTRPGSKD